MCSSDLQPLQIVAREGDPCFGIPGDVFATPSSISMFTRPMDSIGRILFVGTISGPDVTTGVNDTAVFLWDPATGGSLVARRGQAIPALNGDAIGAIQTSGPSSDCSHR